MADLLDLGCVMGAYVAIGMREVLGIVWVHTYYGRGIDIGDIAAKLSPRWPGRIVREVYDLMVEAEKLGYVHRESWADPSDPQGCRIQYSKNLLSVAAKPPGEDWHPVIPKMNTYAGTGLEA